MHHHLIWVWITVAISLFAGVAVSLWVALSAGKDGKAEETETQKDISPIIRERIPGTRL